jgi:FHA domain-containing protein
MPPPAAPADAGDLVAAFLDGAGLQVDPRDLGDQAALFRLVGQVVQASIEGAGNYLRTQVYFKRELRIEHTVIAPRSNNPLKFVSDYQALAKVLLLQHSDAFMDGPAAIREALQEAQHSYLAHYKAMQASVLAAFDLVQAGAADSADAGASPWWPWAALRRQQAHLQQQAQDLAALRQAFSDGDGPIQDAYLKAYLQQIAQLRAEHAERDRQRLSG